MNDQGENNMILLINGDVLRMIFETRFISLNQLSTIACDVVLICTFHQIYVRRHNQHNQQLIVLLDSQ